MKADSMQRLVQHLRQAAGQPGGDELTDGQLLEAFLAHRDETAFAALVRRHGPMVLGVCRRILNHTHDAEDAFQATFLILVRKARSVVPRERVGNWLYGVAYRTALEARRAMARRRIREKQAGPKPVAVAEEQDTDWQPLLDQELSRLPEKYRLPLVLCLLEGRSRKAVARQLRWPEGTLSSRLATARRLLAQRLRSRGLELAGAMGAAVLSPHTVQAAAPNPLVAVTLDAARTLAAGQAIPTVGLVSAPVAALMKGVLQAMLWTRLKVLAMGFLVLALVGLAAGMAAYHTGSAAQAAAPEGPLLQPPVPEPGTGVKGNRKSSARFPAAPVPFPVLVSLEPQGRMKLKQRVTNYRWKERASGQMLNDSALVTQTMTAVYPLADVRVYDLQGNSIERLDSRTVAERLKTEVLALALEHGQPLDPLLRSLIRSGTLLFVLPGPNPPAPAVSPSAPPVPEVPPTQLPAAPDPAVQEIPAPPAIALPPPEPPRSEKMPADDAAALRREIDRLNRENQYIRRMIRESLNDQLSVIQFRDFAIPYSLGAEGHNELEQLSLFVSSDHGKTWTLVGQKKPREGEDQGSFRFSAPADGLYWFTVQITRKDGTVAPPDLAKVPPGLRILVQTKRGER